MRILEQTLKDMMDEDLRELLGPATVEEHGDLALPCHSLTPIRKRSPVDIAESLSSQFSAHFRGIAEVLSLIHI